MGLKAIGLIVFLFICSNAFAKESAIKVCGEPWAPYFYSLSSDEKLEDKTPQGVNVDLFKAISEIIGIEFEPQLIPWSRCLKNTENYKSIGKHEVASDATFNDSRAEHYYFVGPLYSAPSSLFFSYSEYPNGVVNPVTQKLVTSMDELKHFKICGMQGWNYEIYTSAYGIPQENIIYSTHNNIDSLLQLLAHGRCNVFETQASLIAGGLATGKVTHFEEVGCQKLDMAPVNFYLMVSKQSPRAEKLVTLINQAIISLKQSGRHQEIVEAHISSVLGGKEQSLIACM
ncbi:substrate-binding periplasmic protein [Vibrio sp. TRT 21S02]|uniref:substrate-binding periplasmic protein n=1 Tax=Vibrio sp. TRT 21S02 TaxID=3418507 RepID=UPI003CE8789D